MEKRKWRLHRAQPGEPSWMTTFTLGERPVALPDDAIVSVTWLDHLSTPRAMVNALVSLFVMRQLTRVPGLLYSELKTVGVGCGYTLSVWESKAMIPFRDRGAHRRAMRFFSWVFMGGKAHAAFLTWQAKGRIPRPEEIPPIVRAHGRYYVDGVQVQHASRPTWGTAVGDA